MVEERARSKAQVESSRGVRKLDFCQPITQLSHVLEKLPMKRFSRETYIENNSHNAIISDQVTRLFESGMMPLAKVTNTIL